MEPLHAVFDAYRLEELDINWINQVWDSEFTNIDNVPIDYLMFLESPDMVDLLKETCVTVKDWMEKNLGDENTAGGNSSSNRREVSWETLLAMNLDVRALLAVLTYLTKKGQAFDASQDSRQSCLRATSLYFILLAIPGSDTFQAFHPVLFEIALKTLNLSRRLIPRSKKSSIQDYEEENDANENEDESVEMTLSRTQTITLTKGLNSVMYDLVILLSSANVRLEIHSLEFTISNLVELTKLSNETVNNFLILENRNEASVNSLVYNAYVALYAICNKKYGSIELITRLIAKYILPLFCVGNAQLPSKQMTIIRDSAIHFFETLLKQHGQSAQSTLSTLIQHLMIKIPDRSEGRQKQAILIRKLINLCTSKDAFGRLLRDLVLFSHHNKISCRIFAQEIIGKFLLELPRTQNHEDEKNSLWPVRKTKKLLLATVLSGCLDVSSMVRGRAIATFAEYTESIEDPEVQEIFTLTRINSGKEMPSLDKLVEAIDSEEIDIALPDLEGIIEMLRRRGEDERALVRKSALQALRNGVLISEELLDEIKKMIQFHCRDTTLTVRRFAIRVLTTLLEKFPESSSLCKDWVNFVVPRVFDSEAKVQEEVLDSLEKLTIAKIVTSRNSENSTRTDLPWSILKEIAVNKMGDHLTRACEIWIKCKTITDEKVHHIKSHIGTENDIEAWLLLASISENMILLGMEKYDKYYEQALNDTDNDHAFLANLCLQVLRHSWPSFDNDSLHKIRADLSQHLNAYEIRVALLSPCLDILYGITKRLENKPDIERETMRDLMRLSESTIGRIIETSDKIENSQTENLLFRAVCTLGHASLLCCDKIFTASLRTLQGFLLERNRLPEALRSNKELQGAAITVLAQQALRDRDIAQEVTPIFGRLLRNTRENSSHNLNENMASGPAVRINAAKALADICTKFTSLVEPYLPDMCVSMKDTNPDVRQVILVIFIQLLVEDFIKINGAFFFHILTMLADSDETIRQMTMFLIKERLMTKNKALITQQLVQSLFHFNDYERNVTRSRKNSREIRALTLSGEKNSEKRRMIYDFMLEHLDSPGKLAVFATLTKQIFRRSNTLGTSIEQINFNCEKGRCVLRDAIYIASSDYLQPSSCGKQTNDEDNTEDGPQSSSIVNSAIIEAMKKHRLNVLLPSLVELKRNLAKTNSSLLYDVIGFINKTLGDYNKDQLAAFYNEYPKFEKELERDMRNCESATRRRAVESSMENSDGINNEKSKSASPKIPNAIDTNSLLINPDRTPRIVLRRISTLTYPGISGWQTPAHHSTPASIENKISKRSESPKKRNLQKSLQSSPPRSRSSSRSRESTKQHGHISRDEEGATMESSSNFIHMEEREKLTSREDAIALEKNSSLTSSDRVPRVLLKRLSIHDYPRSSGRQREITANSSLKPIAAKNLANTENLSSTNESKASRSLRSRSRSSSRLREAKKEIENSRDNIDAVIKTTSCETMNKKLEKSSTEAKFSTEINEYSVQINPNRSPRILLERLSIDNYPSSSEMQLKIALDSKVQSVASITTKRAKKKKTSTGTAKTVGRKDMESSATQEGTKQNNSRCPKMIERTP